MGRLVVLLVLAVFPLGAVECTSVTLNSKTLQQVGNRFVIIANVSFVGDTVTEPSRDFRLSGNVTQATLDRLAFTACETLTGFAALTVGAITPAGPTPVEQAVQDANLARRQLRNLNDYQAESLKVNTDSFGTSGITFTQARNSLISDAEADITNAARLDIFLDQTR